jgi:uncharacterized membrane protein
MISNRRTNDTPDRPGRPHEDGVDSFITENVQTVSRVESGALRRRSAIERLSDAISKGAGTSGSVILHALLFGGWLSVNAQSTGWATFDPFPFGLLTTIVSLEAIFLSLFILISQNRMSRNADQREHLDLQINMLAEQESTATLKLLRRLAEHHGLDLDAFDRENRSLEKKTNIHELIAEIDRQLPRVP